MRGIEPPFNPGNTLLLQLILYKGDHLSGFGELIMEMAIHVAQAAIFGVFAAIGFSSTMLWILFHRHPATLAKSIELSHLIIDLVKVIVSNNTKLIDNFSTFAVQNSNNVHCHLFMLSRRHLRIKTLQALYAFFQSGNDNLSQGEKLLMRSLDKLHELFITQLSLIIELTDFSRQRLEDAKQKYFPTEENLNPNTRFVDNPIIRKLASNKDLQQNIEKYKINWFLDQELVKKLFVEVKESPEYKEYMESDNDSFAYHASFAGKVVKKFIAESAMLEDFYEDKSIFWAADFPVSSMLVLKTLKSIDADTLDTWLLPNLLKTEDNPGGNEDMEFMTTLFRKTILRSDELEALIRDKAQHWEIERIASMDILLIKMALCEWLELPSVPVKVTLDEYIEIAKYFSTPKSNQFINGILDKILEQLRQDKKIIKRGRGLMT
jgi:transcription antitermination protein NusB